MASPSSQVLHATPINRTEIDQALLNIERKDRKNPLPWSGQFSPQFVETLLEKYTSDGDCVLDPFSGSGTVLLEAAKKKLAAAGADINPAACYLARLYTLSTRSLSTRREACDRFEAKLRAGLSSEALRSGTRGPKLISSERAYIAAAIRKDVAGTDEAVLFAAVLILSDFFCQKTTEDGLFDAWRRARRIVLGLSESDHPIRVFNSDARALPLRNSLVDIVITSPPYINVFNYHQHSRPTVEALGWRSLQVAKAEIGSNRKHRANRFLTVIQYCLDMVQVFSEIDRVCKRGSRIIFVVGRESRIRGVPFHNAKLIASVAEGAGFKLTIRQERVFTNRFGQSIFEDILHFVPSRLKKSDQPTCARQIALDSLSEGAMTADGEVRANIEDAIKFASRVQPSPIFDQACAFTRPNQLKDATE